MSVTDYGLNSAADTIAAGLRAQAQAEQNKADALQRIAAAMERENE